MFLIFTAVAFKGIFREKKHKFKMVQYQGSLLKLYRCTIRTATLAPVLACDVIIQ